MCRRFKPNHVIELELMHERADMTKNSTDKVKLNSKDWATWLGASLVVLCIWLVSWYLIDNNIKSTTPDQTIEVARGVFGDKFGAVNALFSGLAFAGIIFTIFLQRRELALQRLDIEEQNDTLRQQRFENSFFHLLSLHGSIVDNLEITSFRSRQAFTYFIDLLKSSSTEFAVFQPLSRLTLAQIHELRGSGVLTHEMRARLDSSEISTIESTLEKGAGVVGKYLEGDHKFHQDLLDKGYLIAHEKSKDGLSHYFRNLYHIFRFIEDSKLIDTEEKKKYARITRAQLSDQELVAVLYNCLALARDKNDHQMEFGFPKMTRLVKDYDILQNLNSHSLIHPIHLTLLQSLDLEAK